MEAGIQGRCKKYARMVKWANALKTIRVFRSGGWEWKCLSFPTLDVKITRAETFHVLGRRYTHREILGTGIEMVGGVPHSLFDDGVCFRLLVFLFIIITVFFDGGPFFSVYCK